MANQDWLLMDDGRYEASEIIEEAELSVPYRLFRFLTNLEDILQNISDDKQRLQEIRPLVRRLLNSSEWLHYEYLEPDVDTGWSVTTLYDEPDFPLTVQTVAWLPGSVSPIHNHATWGVVAILSGQEKNTFWKQVNPDLNSTGNERIEKAGELILSPGDIISFTPDAIHNIEVMGDEPTVSFNLYGETNYDQRFEFDPINFTATNF
ncbi:MAG: cupin [Rivularia sp. ALOHA_DT_140]|nr:cupin [Rivularia sp. ALOHA_DT_140]